VCALGSTEQVDIRLNAVCPYFTMFPLDFPLEVLRAAGRDEWVLDPFCGRGTTLFAARLLGLPGVGIDVNPVATALAEAKLAATSAEAVIRSCRSLLQGPDTPPLPDGEFWTWAFHPETLRAICVLRARLASEPPSATTVMLRALLLGVLHGPLTKRAPSYLSNQMPRTYATKPAAAVRYWQARRLAPQFVDLLDVVSRRARHALAHLPPRTAGHVVRGDATTTIPTLRRRFRWVITSPPYYGMRTYAPDQWLRMWFLGGPPHVTYQSGDQLAQSSEEAFVAALAGVWRSAAERCHSGARLVVRLGALPCRRSDPRALLSASIEQADAGWARLAVRSAGAPRRQRRQAEQFVATGHYAAEVDATAILR